MTNKNIVVTGVAGFIGHAVSKMLIEEGYNVFGIDNINDYYSVNLKYDRLKDLGIEKENAEKWNCETISEVYSTFRFIRMNLEDKVLAPEYFKNKSVQCVVHLAAQAGVRYSLENPMAYIDSNIVAFMNILEACRHNNISHLVYASSSSVYGENYKVPFSEKDRVDYPVSLYAATKKSNELMAYTYSHLYNLKTSGLRFFTVYGPWGRPDMAPMLFANAINKNLPIKIFNHGEMKRDFTYIDDIVKGIKITIENPPSEGETFDSKSPNSYHQIFNIGNGSPVHLLKFVEIMEKEMGKEAKKKYMDMQAGDVPQTWADTTRLNSLGYESKTSIEEGVLHFIKWFKGYYK